MNEILEPEPEPKNPSVRRLQKVIREDRLEGTRGAKFGEGDPIQGTPTDKATADAHHTMHEEPPPKPARTPEDIAAGRG